MMKHMRMTVLMVRSGCEPGRPSIRMPMDRQADGKTDRQTDRQAGRHRHRHRLCKQAGTGIGIGCASTQVQAGCQSSVMY